MQKRGQLVKYFFDSVTDFAIWMWTYAEYLLCFSEPNLLVRGCNQLGQFLSHRETNLRYLALETMCLLATSEFSHEAVKKHQETVINALKVINYPCKRAFGKYLVFNFYL